jgi:hypothetical protein
LLPSRAHPLSYEDLARALLGFVATAQHKDAPEAARKFSAARAAGHMVPCDELHDHYVSRPHTSDRAGNMFAVQSWRSHDHLLHTPRSALRRAAMSA